MIRQLGVIAFLAVISFGHAFKDQDFKVRIKLQASLADCDLRLASPSPGRLRGCMRYFCCAPCLHAAFDQTDIKAKP